MATHLTDIPGAGAMVFYSLSTLLMLGVGVAALSWAACLLTAGLDRYSVGSLAILGGTMLAAIGLTALAAGAYVALRALRAAVRDTRFANA